MSYAIIQVSGFPSTITKEKFEEFLYEKIRDLEEIEIPGEEPGEGSKMTAEENAQLVAMMKEMGVKVVLPTEKLEYEGIGNIRVPINHATGESRGIAVFDMSDVAKAEELVENMKLKEYEYEGNAVRWQILVHP